MTIKNGLKPIVRLKGKNMNFKYSTITRTLTVFGAKMTHIFSNVGVGEIEELVINAKLKEATWRA